MVETNQPGAPNVTLENNLRLYLGGKRVEIYHFGRAHTDGDIVAYFPDHRVAAMGDMFTVGDGLPPLVDYPGGGSTREWPRSLEGALALDFETAIPGHGKPATKEDLRKYRDNLTMLGRRVHEMLTKNAPRAEVEKELRSRFGFQDFHIQLSLDGLLAELR
jgi:glyoxylase-like metal-dependent hydrolase (beta-lactamase superfamily II)